MNDDENITGPQPWLDPALEARVVADALGETSAFEAAELHRLMQDNPELAIFKRRIEAVHALVGVAVRPDQPKIRMSPDRRQKLLEAIGVPAARPDKTRRVLAFPRPAWFSSTNLIRVAASLVIGAILVASSLMVFKESKRRLVASVSGIADPSASSSFYGESSSFVSADKEADATSSTRAVAARVVVRDGQTATEGILQNDAPVGEKKAMDLAMAISAPTKSREAEEIPPAPTTPTLTAGNTYAGAMSVNNDGLIAHNTASAPESHLPAPQEMAKLEVAVQMDAETKQSPAAPRSESGAFQEAKKPANELVATTDELRSSARTFRESSAYAMQAPAAPAGMAQAQIMTDDSALPVQELTKELSEAERSRSEKQNNSSNAVIVRALAMTVEKSKALDNQPPHNTAGDRDDANRAGDEKFQGFINYGSPIARQEPAAAITVNGAGTLAVTEPLFSTRTTTAPAGPEVAESAAELPSADQAPGAQSTIRTFTGGWAKGSGSGGGVANDSDRARLAQTDIKEQIVLEEDSNRNGGSLRSDSTSRDMFLGVNVGNRSGADNSSNSKSDGSLPSSAETPAPMEPDAKPKDLMSAPVVTTLSGQRSATGIASELVSAQSQDKSDSAALKGIEQVNKARGKQQDEAYNEASGEKVKQVDRAWNPPVRKISQSSSQGVARPEEIKTAKQPFSTFSLHVSDVSFQLAKDALARGAMPDPERIRPEEFYNAFDYNDPSPAAAEEVACRVEQCAHPFLQQRNLVRIALKVAAAGRSAGQPLRLTLLLDTSGSMEREDRAASVRRAIQTLATLLGPNDRVTLIGFARTPRLLAEQVPGDEAGKLVEIASHTPSEGGTNLEQALALASELALKQKVPAAQNRIVLLTDGAANLGNADPTRLARQIEKTRQQGISFDACGVGANGLNDEMLEALTRKGDGRYYFLNRPEDAGAGFAQQLAGALRPAAENVKVQVHFNPDRVGQYRLIGFEKHLLKKEDFRNDKVGAAELSAEEAGVAVYQVETLPDGEGDLGQVFVRFRDPATGSMVERAWTMPYDPKAPAFDQASPSMQLAATSALVAENLRGDSKIDLNSLAPVTNSLRGHFPNQRKVAELLQMIERLRQ